MYKAYVDCVSGERDNYVLCQAKVFDLSDDEIKDIYLYGGIVWFHPSNGYMKQHYHVAKYVAAPEVLEEMIFCLCDQTVIAICLLLEEFKCYICNYGYKVYSRKTDDIECVEV